MGVWVDFVSTHTLMLCRFIDEITRGYDAIGSLCHSHRTVRSAAKPVLPMQFGIMRY